MKVTMRLTLDGLVRAMRIKAHELAETVESRAPDAQEDPRRRGVRQMEDENWPTGGEHDRRGS